MMHRFVRTIAAFSFVFGLALTTTASAATPADLSVSIKEQTSGPYTAGSIVTYRIRAFNEVTSAVSSYSVYTTVKASSVAPLIPIAPAPDSNCILSMPSQAFVCEYFRVDAGKAKFQDISFRVPDTLTSCPFAVSPKVQIASRLTPDLNTANDINKARPDTAIQCASQTSADLSITQQSVPNGVQEGGAVTSVFTVTNNGPAAAQSVMVTQSIPAGFAFVPSQSYPFCTQIGSVIQCNATTMTVGQTRSMYITYAITDNSVFCTERSIAMTSQVSSSITDSVLSNNQSQSSVAVTCKAQPKLTVTQKATASTDTALQNQKNVNLLRFEVNANQVADLLLTGATFTQAGNLTMSNAQMALINAQNYTLWVDTNSDAIVDTILQSGKAAQAGEIGFNNIAGGGGYVILKNQSVMFEVHADIAPSFTTPQPQLQLAFNANSSFVIEAETLADGFSLFGNQIQLSTVSSTLYTLKSSGTLSLAQSTTPVKSHQLLGGTLSDDILRLTTHAEFEDIDVTTLVFSATGTNASSFTTDVDRLELYKVGATTPFAVATIGSCGTMTAPANSMCVAMNNQELIIPKGSDTNVIVRARMRSDVDGAVSGHQFALSLNPALTQARGMTSSNTLSALTGSTITSRTQTVVLSRITSITSVDPNVNGTAIPTGFRRAIGQFKFATAAQSNTKNGSNKFVLDGIIFTLNAQNVSIDSSSFKLYNKADPTVTSGCTLSSATTVTCANLKDSSINSFIDAGTDATFVLEATIVNSKVLNSLPSILQVSINNFENSMTSAFGASAMESHLKWFDKDNASETSFLWVEYPETQVNGTQYQN